MSEVNSILQVIKEKAEELGAQKNAMAAKVNSLQEENAQLMRQIEEQQRQLEDLKDKNNVLKMAKSFGDDGEKATDAKRRVNELVKEIDKCIALLNK